MKKIKLGFFKIYIIEKHVSCEYITTYSLFKLK